MLHTSRYLRGANVLERTYLIRGRTVAEISALIL